MIIYLTYWVTLVINLQLTSNSNIIDFNLRIISNDTICNYLNFFWTSTTYLIIFSNLLLILTLLRFFLQINLINNLLLMILFFVASEVNDFLTVNIQGFISTSLDSDINLLLQNNLNKYHPYILYVSAFFFIHICYGSYLHFISTSKFTNCLRTYYYLVLNLKSLLWNSCALFLGSWWALQEGTWGGWWNWDTSEVLGLVIFLNTSYNLHFFPKIYSSFFLYNRVLKQTSLLISFFILLQLSFEITSHSFGSRLSYFFNNNFFLIELVLIFCSSFFIKQKEIFTFYSKLKQISPRVVFKNHLLFNWYLFWALLTLLTSGLIVTINPLFNYFFWKFFEINLINFTVDVTLIFILLSIVWLTTHIYNPLLFTNTCILILLLIQWSLNTTSLLLLNPQLTFLSITHVFFLINFLLNLFSFDLDLICHIPEKNISKLDLNLLNIEHPTVVYNCLNFLVETNNFILVNNHSRLNMQNLLFYSNQLQINSFYLLFNSEDFINVYPHSYSFQQIFTQFNLPSLEPFVSLVVLNSLLYIYLVSSPSNYQPHLF